MKNDNETLFFLVPEAFSNLPCLLLYEEKMEPPPVAMITWTCNNYIVFSWQPFSSLTTDWKKDITIIELINSIKKFFLNSEG